MSNILIVMLGEWSLLSDGVQFFAAFSLLLWLQRTSPFRPFSLAEASRAVQRIDLSLASNGKSFPLHLRAALARAALGDYMRARRHADQCLRLRRGHAFAHALSGVIRVLQGETTEGEELLRFSYHLLTQGEKRTLQRLSRHVVRSGRTDNAYNEFQLSIWVRLLKDGKLGPSRGDVMTRQAVRKPHHDPPRASIRP